MLNKDSDILVFMRLKNGDMDALEILFKRYYESLCNFANTYLQDFELTEDIVNDVFILLWDKRKRINIKSNFKSYLFTITKNTIFEYLRKNKIYFEKLDSIKDFSSPNELIEELDKMEIKQIIKFLLDKIPPKSRRVFLMHRMDKLKYKEIAEVLNISIKTVENHIGKALKILRENKNILKRFLSFLLFLSFR